MITSRARVALAVLLMILVSGCGGTYKPTHGPKPVRHGIIYIKVIVQPAGRVNFQGRILAPNQPIHYIYKDGTTSTSPTEFDYLRTFTIPVKYTANQNFEISFDVTAIDGSVRQVTCSVRDGVTYLKNSGAGECNIDYEWRYL